MIRRPPRSTQGVSSAASDVYKRQYQRRVHGGMEKFIVVHKGESIDYVSKLKKTKFGVHNVLAYDFVLDRKTGYKGGGDWGFVAVPYPYYEGSEDIYIQQITKVFVNKNDIITDWNERIAKGYPEILPKNNPMNVWVGGLFTGQVVDGAGNAVSNAEIEVEYLNADIDICLLYTSDAADDTPCVDLGGRRIIKKKNKKKKIKNKIQTTQILKSQTKKIQQYDQQ
eukprot:TRINITY_DN20053_c0_g1_i7.p1 TRINITY_DN20053_c0_g1~~TRINITY_DN20053_c0_g1_i7.p1  ORF type:complete len:224 (-),score=69.27 TRINITY_DN20053_c0_g1_i7:13-684(-)